MRRDAIVVVQDDFKPVISHYGQFGPRNEHQILVNKYFWILLVQGDILWIIRGIIWHFHLSLVRRNEFKELNAFHKSIPQWKYDVKRAFSLAKAGEVAQATMLFGNIL